MKTLAILLYAVAGYLIGNGLYLLHPALGWIHAGLATLMLGGWTLSVARKREQRRKEGRPLPMRPGGPFSGRALNITGRSGQEFRGTVSAEGSLRELRPNP